MRSTIQPSEDLEGGEHSRPRKTTTAYRQNKLKEFQGKKQGQRGLSVVHGVAEKKR